MWRWWIAAGLVVMALGVVAMAVVSYSGGPSRCIGSTIPEGGYWFPFTPFGTQASEELRQRYPSDLSVEFGETTWLTMTLRNAQDYQRTLTANAAPLPVFVVTTPDCREVWRSPMNQFSGTIPLDFEPHETRVFGGSWSLTDNWGEMIAPGDYYVYGIVQVEEEPIGGGVQLVAYGAVRVEEAHLRAVRPRNPPVPVRPSACGEPVSEARLRRVVDVRSETLSDWQSIDVLIADILDENRVTTGVRGIRVVVRVPAWMPTPESVLRRVPECLDGVPVQIVVRPDEYE